MKHATCPLGQMLSVMPRDAFACTGPQAPLGLRKRRSVVPQSMHSIAPQVFSATSVKQRWNITTLISWVDFWAARLAQVPGENQKSRSRH